MMMNVPLLRQSLMSAIVSRTWRRVSRRRTCRISEGRDVARTRSWSRRTPEKGSQLGRLGSMHHRQDLIIRLQDEVRPWDQELATADDGRQGTLARQWQLTQGHTDGLGPGMHLLFDQRILPLA